MDVNSGNFTGDVQVRAGNSAGGTKGTHFGAGYDPETDKAVYEIYDGSIYVTDESTGRTITMTASYGDPIKRIEISSDGKFVPKIAIPTGEDDPVPPPPPPPSRPTRRSIENGVTVPRRSTPPAAPSEFIDVDTSHSNFEAIIELSKRNVIGGYEDGSFKPEQTVNRVEALKMIFTALPLDDPAELDELDFSDTNSTAWYAPFLRKAVSLGVVKGYPDGTYRPDQTVKLVEALKIMLEASGADLPTDITEDPYADAPAGQWFTPYVQFAKDNGLIDADASNKIYPDTGVSRAMLAEILHRYLMVLEGR